MLFKIVAGHDVDLMAVGVAETSGDCDLVVSLGAHSSDRSSSISTISAHDVDGIGAASIGAEKRRLQGTNFEICHDCVVGKSLGQSRMALTMDLTTFKCHFLTYAL